MAEYVPPEEVISTVTKGSIMSGSTRNFTVDLVVPDFIAPNLEDCSVIDVGYFFRVSELVENCIILMSFSGVVGKFDTRDGTNVSIWK